MSKPTSTEIIHAYRHLYRSALQAVQYSMPARFTARDKLRDAFRTENPDTFNKENIETTIEFLRNAAQERGLEHKIVKNLLHTTFWRKHHLARQSSPKSIIAGHLKETGMDHYNMTLAMLNDSMGLCLR